MNNLEMNILCDGCPRRKWKIKSSGSMYGVDYVTLESKKRYIIEDNPKVSWDEIMRNRGAFTTIYVPKFGKYEIEEFVSHKMMEALLITRDITDLLNSELLCEDIPFNITRVKQPELEKAILRCFDVAYEDVYKKVVKLVFKWKPYLEIE